PCQRAARRPGLLQVTRRYRGSDRLVAVALLDPLPLLVALPPVPAPDQGEPESDARHQPQGVAAQPVADPLALFVVVVDFVDCHAVSRPARARADCKVRICLRAAAPEPAVPLHPLRGWRQSVTGASEPSEDTVKRATFARWKGARS